VYHILIIIIIIIIIISYHIIAEFIVRLLQKKEMVRFQQFSKSDKISHGEDVVRQCVPGGRTSMGKRTLSEPCASKFYGIVEQFPVGVMYGASVVCRTNTRPDGDLRRMITTLEVIG